MNELVFHTLGPNACAFALSERHHARLCRARLLWGTLASSGVLCVVLVGDFFGRYLPRDPTGGLVSFASILALGGLLGLMMAFSKWIFKERWVLDCAGRTLSRQRALRGRGMHPVESVELEHVEAWVVGEAGGIGVRFGGGEQMALVQASRQECLRVQKKVEAFARSRRVHIRWELGG